MPDVLADIALSSKQKKERIRSVCASEGNRVVPVTCFSKTAPFIFFFSRNRILSCRRIFIAHKIERKFKWMSMRNIEKVLFIFSISADLNGPLEKIGPTHAHIFVYIHSRSSSRPHSLKKKKKFCNAIFRQLGKKQDGNGPRHKRRIRGFQPTFPHLCKARPCHRKEKKKAQSVEAFHIAKSGAVVHSEKKKRDEQKRT